jgi:hypothetical protein
MLAMYDSKREYLRISNENDCPEAVLCLILKAHLFLWFMYSLQVCIFDAHQLINSFIFYQAPFNNRASHSTFFTNAKEAFY